MVNRVVLAPSVQKLVTRKPPRLPAAVVTSLLNWVKDVADRGLAETRKVPGYHDEPLAGDRSHQRSVRLNQGWRAIYEMRADDTGELVEVVEITNHEY